MLWAIWWPTSTRRASATIIPGHGGGPRPLYTAAERECILARACRAPDWEQDGTATWSLSTLRQAIWPELSKVSTYTLWCVLHEAGSSWQKSRTWCDTGRVQRPRKRESPLSPTPTERRKKLIETAHRLGASLGLAVWNQDEAGPYQSIPSRGRVGSRLTSRMSMCAAAWPRC